MLPACRRIHRDLPIFQVETAPGMALYAPGRLATVNRPAAEELERAWRNGTPLPSGPLPELAAELTRCAAAADLEWRRLWHEPAEPRCLTLHLGSSCNLACTYCYASQRHGTAGETGQLSTEAIRSAATVVAQSCARCGEPLHLVVHGHGEPTRSWSQIERLQAVTAEVAAQVGVAPSSYVATNGMLSEARAAWLAQTFDRVGLSCDGPPHIQDRLRPQADGRPTSDILERAARTVVREGGALETRTTVVAETAAHQVEIVEYLNQCLGARVLRFEPVYRSPRPWSAEAIDTFVQGFVAATRRARTLGCRLSFSGARPGEIHGPYCDPLQGVLRLVPPGRIPACFLAGSAADGRQGGTWTLGHADAGSLELEHERIAALGAAAGRVPERCHHCVNLCHCARDCPDVCHVDQTQAAEPGPRCQISRRLTLAWIEEAAAEAAGPASVEVTPPGFPGSGSDDR